MKEVLFKAKRIDNNEWIEGFYTQVIFTQDCFENEKILNGHFIISKYEFWVNIDPKTLSQYTGLKDKNGKKIFENYILDYWENGKENIKQRLKVFYENGQFVVDYYAINLLNSRNMSSEIIGNIFDNPELLTKE